MACGQSWLDGGGGGVTQGHTDHALLCTGVGGGQGLCWGGAARRTGKGAGEQTAPCGEHCSSRGVPRSATSAEQLCKPLLPAEVRTWWLGWAGGGGGRRAQTTSQTAQGGLTGQTVSKAVAPRRCL